MDNKRSATPTAITSSQATLEHADSPKRKRPRLDENVTQETSTSTADADTPAKLSPTSATNSDLQVFCKGKTSSEEGMSPERCQSTNNILGVAGFRPLSQQITIQPHLPAQHVISLPKQEHDPLSPTAIMISNTSRTPSESPPVVEVIEDDSEDGTGIETEDPDAIVIEALNSFPYAEHYGLLEALHVIIKAIPEDNLGEEIYLTLEAWMDRWNSETPMFEESKRSAILKNTQFWVELANLIYKILLKKTPSGLGRKPRALVKTLLKYYIELCGDLIQNDLVELIQWKEGFSNPSHVVFWKHIRNIEYIVQPWRLTPIWKLLDTSSVSPRTWHEQLVKEFVDLEVSVVILDYATILAERPELWKHFWQQLLTSVKALYNTIQALCEIGTSDGQDETAKHEYDFIMKSLRVSELISQSLLDSTTTLTASIPVDATSNLAIYACSITQGLGMLEPAHAKRFIKLNINTNAYELGTEHLVRLANDSSKLELMLQFLTSGRMELRISSVYTLNQVLVNLWKDYNNLPGSAQHPVLQAIAQWILEHKVIDMLVSPESHPQLLMRSSQIFGFLAVTSRWTLEITDSFWSRMLSMQDQRLAAAALAGIQDNLQHMDTPQVKYFAEKIKQVPLAGFSKGMTDFVEKLLAQLASQDECTDTVTELCLHLLRQSGDNPISNVHMHASENLKRLSREKFSAEQRHELYSHCLASTKDVTPQAYGSIQAIYAMVSVQGPADLVWLVNEANILSTLTVLACHAADVSLSRDQRYHRLSMTMWLLGFVLRRVPGSAFEHADETVLVQHLVGEHAADHEFRNLAWDHLKNLASDFNVVQSSFLNNFIDIHLPQIAPQHFTTGLLDFVGKIINYEQGRHQPSSTAEEETITPPLAGVIWHIVLDAPDHTIETSSIAFLSKTYVEAPWIMDAPVTLINATHTALVSRSIRQLEVAAAALRDPSIEHGRGDIPVDEGKYILEDKATHADMTVAQLTVAERGSSEMSSHRRHFSRTVHFLEQFVKDVKQRASLNDQATESRLPSPMIKTKLQPSGEDTAVLKYQPFATGKQGDVRDLRVSSSTTFAQLADELRKHTGFAKFKIVHCGKSLDLERNPDHSAASLAETGLLIVRDLGSVAANGERGPKVTFGSSAAERAVSAHIDTLVNFLDLDAELSRSVYELLTRFPPHVKVRDLVMLGISGLAELFPVGMHYPTVYSLSCIRRHLTTQLSAGSPDENFLLHGIRALTEVLVAEQFSDVARSQEAACVLVDTLVLCLKERPLSSDVLPFLADQKLIGQRLFDMLKYSRAHPEGALGRSAYPLYAALVEATLRGPEIWKVLTSWDERVEIHLWLLTCPSAESISNLIKLLTTNMPPDSCVTRTEFALFHWDIASTLIERLPQSATSCKYVMQTAAVMFEEHTASIANEATLRHYLETWSTILVQHSHSEVPGQGFVNELILGLVRLTTTCVSYLKAFSKPFPAQELAVLLLDQYLFPPIQDVVDNSYHISQSVLDSDTRKHMYTLLLSLCDHHPTYLLVSDKLSAIVSEEAAAPNQDWNSNIVSWLRAVSGYSGLRNLTNTCYMNSLMTQLFMNVQFRNYVLGATITPKAQHDIMTGIQELFARMQLGSVKYANTYDFARAVKPYDSEHIDVTIQMDVDEFYNLLFDRLENEMPDNDAKRKLRSFWGGNLVTQIKSMDCEHVSERAEPFIAIQCDMKEKANLEESLKAYVEGDVMEGDNKYKCESCDNRLVDAVKRSCLKDLPDNLIFHLKRFDFDLTTFQRNKINDHFEFPTKINMTPYTLEQLTNQDVQRDEDVFELVGVLVHSGTAETGHYYSYIRLPLRSSNGAVRWAEFNDTEVSEFDPSRIPEQCFGGSWDDNESRLRYPKPNSAYMLFYQRMQSGNGLTTTSDAPSATELAATSVAPQLATKIQKENQEVIRRYCLYDPVHAQFTKAFVNMLKHFNSGVCSPEHHIEKEVLRMSLQYAVLVAARVKGAADVEPLLQLVHKTTSVCNDCTLFLLQWLTGPDRLPLTSDMLLSCPASKARQAWASLLSSMMSDLRRTDIDNYGIDTADQITSQLRVSGDGVLTDVVSMLQSLVTYLGRNFRAWDEFFGLLAAIASLGVPEVKTLLCFGIFRDCLELVCYDNGRVNLLDTRRNLTTRLGLEKTKKPPSYFMLMKLLYHLMSHLDLFEQPVRNLGEQLRSFDADTNKFPILVDERQVLTGKVKGRLSFISKMLEEVSQSDLSTRPWWPGEVISLIVSNALTQPNHIREIGWTIAADIKDYYPDAVGFSLQAGLSFCRACPAGGDVDDILQAAIYNARQMKEHVLLRRNSLGTIKEPEYLGGENHLDFFYALANMQDAACSSSEDNGLSPHLAATIGMVGNWAPPILVFDSYQTRQRLCKFLDELIFDQYPYDLDENDGLTTRLTGWRCEAVRHLMKSCHHWTSQAQSKGVPKPWGKHIERVMHECSKWINKLMEEESEAYAVFLEPGDEALISVHERARVAIERWRDEDWGFGDDTMVSDEDMLSDLTETEEDGMLE